MDIFAIVKILITDERFESPVKTATESTCFFTERVLY